MPNYRELFSSEEWCRALRALWLDLPEKIALSVLWLFAAAGMLIFYFQYLPDDLEKILGFNAQGLFAFSIVVVIFAHGYMTHKGLGNIGSRCNCHSE